MLCDLPESAVRLREKIWQFRRFTDGETSVVVEGVGERQDLVTGVTYVVVWFDCHGLDGRFNGLSEKLTSIQWRLTMRLGQSGRKKENRCLVFAAHFSCD